jgi:hypothetical protein
MGCSWGLGFPESSERKDDEEGGCTYGPYETLEEAHARLVECAIEDGALPANVRELARKEGVAPQNE